MHSALEPTPGAHEDASDHTANRSRRLDQSQADSVIAGPEQYHRSKDGHSDSKTQIAKEENQLQTEQAGPREDIAKSEGRLFKDIPLCLCTFGRPHRLRDMNEYQN